MSKTEKAIENLNTAKLILYNQQMLTPEMCIRIGQAITDAIDILQEQDKIIQNILREKTNELINKVATLQIESQSQEMRRLLEQKGR